MESVLGRYRNLIALAIVLSAQLLGLAVQVKRTSGNDSTRLIRIWAVGAVTPFEKALNWTHNSYTNVWRNYLYLRGVRAENRELKQQIEQMRLQEVRLAQDADQARRLQALLGFKEQFVSQTMAAQVIGSSGSEQSRSVYIDKGEHDGIKPDMAVISAEGIVGKILHTYPSTSLVLLVNDQSSGVGAILEKSRLQGILRGTSSGEVVLERVMSDETVAPGEQVLTSGGDRIFPKGLPIGAVSKVTPGPDLFLNIRVRPSANLSRLEEVLIVTKVEEKQATPDSTGPMRAADILAERLPTVPPKAESKAGAASPAQSGTKQPSAQTAGGQAAANLPSASVSPAANPKTQAAGNTAANSTPASNRARVEQGAKQGSSNGTVRPAAKSQAITNSTPTAPGHVGSPVAATHLPATTQTAAQPGVADKPQSPPEDNPQ